MTTFSVAATLLLAAGIAILARPQRGAGRGNCRCSSSAQGGSPWPREASKATMHGEPPLEELLNQRIDVNFADIPFTDAIAFIQEKTGIQIVIKPRRL